MKKYALRWGAFGGQSVSVFTLLMNSLNGVPFEGKFYFGRLTELKKKFNWNWWWASEKLPKCEGL